MQLTDEQRIFIVDKYLELSNYPAVINEFRQRFPNRPAPSKSTIKRNVHKFRTTGSIKNQNEYRSGRLRTTRTPENIERIRQAILENPSISSRRNGLQLPKSAFSEIIRLDLNFHPYRMFVRHGLQPGDHPRRMNFAQWFVDKCQQEAHFLDKIVIGDEAAFRMNGKVSSRNVVQYAPKGERPGFCYNVSSSKEKVTVWAALCGNGTILGPYFFDDNVNGMVYLNMLNDDVVDDMMVNFPYNHFAENLFENNIWWFQDGAPCHQSRMVTARLQELFGEQLVALHRPIEWPPRSPDITPCDFFLWGYMKQKVYQTPPNDIFELRGRIINQFNELRNNQDMVIRAVRTMEKRVRVCIEREGGHVEGEVP